MPSSRKLSALAERKNLLIAEADLHRQVVQLESGRLSEQAETACSFWKRRGWIIGGAAVAAGFLLTRGRGRALGALGWLSSAWTVVRKFLR